MGQQRSRVGFANDIVHLSYTSFADLSARNSTAARANDVRPMNREVRRAGLGADAGVLEQVRARRGRDDWVVAAGIASGMCAIDLARSGAGTGRGELHGLSIRALDTQTYRQGDRLSRLGRPDGPARAVAASARADPMRAPNGNYAYGT